ncbi:MAG: zinc ribbon domain-containing protein, partial [Dehalococcoidia bacterium]|nr:zinc ribbon domain-containing protein [Dehalococcoidia bacterium]
MAEPEYPLPIPVADEESEPFFRGAKERRLMLLRCAQCGLHRLPGRERCPECWSTDSAWGQASGRGKLYSFGIMHQQYHPAFADA